MDVRKIAVGGAFWFAGMIVPVLQHGLLSIAAGARGSRYGDIGYNYPDTVRYAMTLPLLTWVYLVVMWGIGTLLIFSGLNRRNENG